MQHESTSPSNAKETHNNNYNSKQLVETVPLEETDIFTAVRKNDEWYLYMGKYRFSEARKSLEEVIEDSKKTDWLRIMQVMRVVILDREEEKQLRETIDKQQQKLEFDRYADQNEADLENKTSL